MREVGLPAAKQGDQIVATDTHIILVPSPGGPVPTPVPLPFSGVLNAGLSADVLIMGRPAATAGSIGINTPPHIPPGSPFARPPANQGRILVGSPTVLINGKQAARNGDQAMTCNDPVDLPGGTVVAAGTVLIG
jgi:uncharacterized Zn-binding protein involved in type VI secretion